LDQGLDLLLLHETSHITKSVNSGLTGLVPLLQQWIAHFISYIADNVGAVNRGVTVLLETLASVFPFLENMRCNDTWGQCGTVFWFGVKNGRNLGRGGVWSTHLVRIRGV
jgi:hypothetical protein